jgi:hypothetical protein
MWEVLPPPPHAWDTGITVAAFEHGAGIKQACVSIRPSIAASARALPASSEHSSSCRSDASRYMQQFHASGDSSRRPCISFSTRGASGRKRGRFAALSLGDWRLRLPALKERSPPYDPWDAASQEAPRGVRRHSAEGTLEQQPAVGSTAQLDGLSAGEPSAAGQPPPPPPPPPQQQQQQQLAPHAQPSDAADAQGGGAASRQPERQKSSGAHSAGGRQRGRGLPAWLVSCGSTPHRSTAAGLLAITTT